MTKLLRIYLNEADRCGNKPLYEAIILQARELNIAGATVLRSPMGYGQTRRLKTSKILNLSINLPMVIDMIDSPEKLDALLPFLQENLISGLVTLQDISVVKFSPATLPTEGSFGG